MALHYYFYLHDLNLCCFQWRTDIIDNADTTYLGRQTMNADKRKNLNNVQFVGIY